MQGASKEKLQSRNSNETLTGFEKMEGSGATMNPTDLQYNCENSSLKKQVGQN